MSRIVIGLDGACVHQDDIIIFGSNPKHDGRLAKCKLRLSEAGLKFYHAKCEYRQTSIAFLGHHSSEKGISPDQGKVNAITNMEAPQNMSKLRRMMGMIQYLGRYMPNLPRQNETNERLACEECAVDMGH